MLSGCLSSGGSALVHCVAGVSRSAALCMAYLVRHRGLSLLRAYEQVRQARPCVRPNRGFAVQLMQWEENCRGGGDVGVAVEDEGRFRVFRDERAAKLARTL